MEIEPVAGLSGDERLPELERNPEYHRPVSTARKADTPTMTFKPNQRYAHGYFKPVWSLLVNLVRQRELLGVLVRRDIVTLYKRSFIGLTWIVLTPLLGIVSWVFLQWSSILHPGDVGVPYPLFVLVGSTIWGLFIGSMSAVSTTLHSSRYLLIHVHFPHEILFGVQVAVKAIYFCISLVIILAMMLILRISPSPYGLLFPVALLPLVMLSAAMGLVLSLISALTDDVDRLILGATSLLLYFTPVIYDQAGIRNPLLARIVGYNPMTYLVTVPRDLLLYGTFANWQGYAIASGGVLLLFILCWRLFYVRELTLVERMIA